MSFNSELIKLQARFSGFFNRLRFSKRLDFNPNCKGKKHLFKELKDSFSLIDNEIIFMANNGNWGDALINVGARNFFSEAGIAYTEVKYNQKYQPPHKDVTFVYCGSGGFSTKWNHVYPIVNRLKDLCKKVIVLPSTYGFKHDYSKEIDWWARDAFTSMKLNKHAKLCPDMALYINKIIINPTKKKGFFYRTDREAVGRKLPKCNYDISAIGDYKSEVNGFFNHIGQYEEIYTDRLHVGIAGYLMDRKVYLSKSVLKKIPDFFKTWFEKDKNIVLVNHDK